MPVQQSLESEEGQTKSTRKKISSLKLCLQKKGRSKSRERKKEMDALDKLRMRRKAHFICSGPALDKRMDYLTSQTPLLLYFLGTFLVICIINWSKSYHLILTI